MSLKRGVRFPWQLFSHVPLKRHSCLFLSRALLKLLSWSSRESRGTQGGPGGPRGKPGGPQGPLGTPSLASLGAPGCPLGTPSLDSLELHQSSETTSLHGGSGASRESWGSQVLPGARKRQDPIKGIS